LEPRFLKAWHIDLLVAAKPKQMFFAYDTDDDWEPLLEASKMLRQARFSPKVTRCYVLIGHPRDTISAAIKRLEATLRVGFYPFAMLWKRNDGSHAGIEWRKLQKAWCRPAIIWGHAKRLCL